MKTFTIDDENNITAYGSREAADQHQPEGTMLFFSSQEQFEKLAASFPMSRLVDLWNSIPGLTPVTKFMNRAAGTRRIWAAIQNLETGESASMPQPAPEEYSEPVSEDKRPSKKTSKKQPTWAKRAAAAKAERATAAAAAKGRKKAKRAPQATSEPREGSKQAQVLDLLRRKQGATITEIMEATDWQRHTVRGFIAGALKAKLKLNVESFKPEGGERTYKVVA